MDTSVCVLDDIKWIKSLKNTKQHIQSKYEKFTFNLSHLTAFNKFLILLDLDA